MKTKNMVLSGVAVVLIVGAAIWGRGDQFATESQAATDVSVEAGAGAALSPGQPAAVTKPISPEDAKIVQSVADLSAQIVNNAYASEKTEALIATAAAVSLRINTLKAESMAQAEKAAAAEYSKALAEAKLKHVEEEAKAALPDNESSQSDNKVLPVNGFNYPAMPIQKPQAIEGEKVKEKDLLDLVSIKAILVNGKQVGGYKAVLTIDGKEHSVREGQIVNGVEVVVINQNDISISHGGKTKILYL